MKHCPLAKLACFLRRRKKCWIDRIQQSNIGELTMATKEEIVIDVVLGRCQQNSDDEDDEVEDDDKEDH